MVLEEFCSDRASASLAAAGHLAEALRGQLARQPEAALVVSGGSTPLHCFEALSKAALPWHQVTLVPSDERWVGPDDAASNENMIRQVLMTDRASAARLLPLYDPQATIESRCADLDRSFTALPLPFAAALLGMGADGHFASLFPDADNLAAGLADDQTRFCLPIRSRASPYPRVSLTLTALSRSEQIILLMFGSAKQAVYEQARSSDERFPISHLLRQEKTPVRVIWAP